MTIKGGGAVGGAGGKNEYLASTEAHLSTRTPGCCVKAFSPWKGKLKEKHNTPLTRPEPLLLFLDGSHKHSKTDRPIHPQGTDGKITTPRSRCQPGPSDASVSRSVNEGSKRRDRFLRCSHTKSSLLERSQRRWPRSRLRALSGKAWGRWGKQGWGSPGDVGWLSTPRAWPAKGRGGVTGRRPGPDGRGGSSRGPEAGERRPRGRVTRRSPARPLAHSLTHSPRGARASPQSL